MSVFFFLNLRSELSPVEDRGVVIVRGSGPEGSTLAYISRYSGQVEKILSGVPEIGAHHDGALEIGAGGAGAA